MRASPSSSDSGWQETSGCAIVNLMSAKRPRSRRSRMWRSVSSYGRGRGRADHVEAELRGQARELCGRHDEDHAREGDPHPRGRRARRPPVRGRPRSRARRGRGADRARGGVAEPSRRVGAQGSSLGAEAPHPRRGRRRRRRGARRRRRRLRRRRPGRDQPGDRARPRSSPSSASTATGRTAS